MVDVSSPLVTELETFARELPRLLETDLGRYALVRGADVPSTWETEDDATQTGYTTYGIDVPFLVKRIVHVELPVEITRINPGIVVLDR